MNQELSMLRIGLTGGIGSGKTTVAKIFEVLGIPVYYADDAAKNLMHTDPALKNEIIRLFGEDAYSGNKLNRAYIASIVFSSPERLDQLNALVHPATLRDAEAWMGRQNSPYSIKEAALIFESGAADMLDKIIGVFAPEALRLKRTMDRDGMSREQVKERMNKQLNQDILMRLCDFKILNDETELLIPQVMAIHEQLMGSIGA